MTVALVLAGEADAEGCAASWPPSACAGSTWPNGPDLAC